MATQIILATNQGIVMVDWDGETLVKSNHMLQDIRFTALASRGATILAGSTDGIYRSTDKGQTWQAANQGLMHPREDLGFRNDQDRNDQDPSAVWIHPDVHSVVVHPSSADVLFAPTEGGL
jgi:hypothetical protein